MQTEAGAKDTRTQLINAAIDMFHEKGFQKTRVSDIVATARVAQGTFYLYFKSKDDVFLHIAAEFKGLFAEIIEGGDNLFAGTSADEIKANLLGFIRDLVQLYSENKKMAKLLFYESGQHDCSFRNIWQDLYLDFIDMTRRQLEQNRDSAFLSFEDAETEAAFLVGLFSRSLFYFIELKNDIDIETLSRRMTAFVLGGLSKQSVSGGM